MYRKNQQLIDLLGPLVSRLGYDLWGIEHYPAARSAILRIYIDCPAGVTVEDCAKVSTGVTGLLDVKDPIGGPYELEVSSPGLDRPLFTLEQVRQYIGHPIRLTLYARLAGRRRFTGELYSVSETDIDIRLDGGEYRIPVKMVEKIRLVPQR